MIALSGVRALEAVRLLDAAILVLELGRPVRDLLDLQALAQIDDADASELRVRRRQPDHACLDGNRAAADP